jgi:outer membrane protein OmpA-like peptidoglycan-associated protein
MMNYNKLFLVSLVFLVPACGNKKASYQQKSKHIRSTGPESYNGENIAQYDYVSPEEKSHYDENLDAFVLSEDDSPFDNNIKESYKKDNVAAHQELQLAPEDQADSFADSAVHGLKSMYYGFGKHQMTDGHQSTLKENYDIAKKLTDKGYTVVCEGHACNSQGSSQSRNITISEERPQHIADYFVSQGIPSEKIKVVGRGAEMKIVPHGTRAQQAPNRRVEFYAYPPGN